MYPLTKQAQGMLKHKIFRPAKLYYIQMTNGDYLLLTDHDQRILYNGSWYFPGFGVSGSNVEQSGTFDASNQEILGVFDTDAFVTSYNGASITLEDVSAGFFRGAKVVEAIIDWYYPWLVYEYNTYYVGDVKYDDQRWNVELLGLESRLDVVRGKTISNRCGYVYGKGDCAPTGVFSATFTVAEISEQRIYFRVSTLNPQYTGYYDNGVIQWTGGDNLNFYSLISLYVYDASQSWITLLEPTVYDISVGDAATMTRACQKTFEDCVLHGMYARFDGVPDPPGEDALVAGQDCSQPPP